MAAIAVLIGGAWDAPIYADGGASARSQAAADETAQAYAQRILRTLADRHTNNWVRYWRARADCDAMAAYARRGDNPPLDRVLLTLTSAICAQLDARLGVNPAGYAPRGDEQTGGLLVNETGAAAGYILFSPEHSKYVYLIDPLGRIAHEWHLQDALPRKNFNHVKLLDNGGLLVLGSGGVLEFDPDGNTLWQYNARIHHDFLKMPNGNVLLLVSERKTREQAIAAGANPEFVHENGMVNERLLEVRPAGESGGEVVWEWAVWDHLIQDFDPSKENYGVVAEHPELIDINFLQESRIKRGRAQIEGWILRDWLHINAIDYNPELDQIMLSPRHFSELWIIDHSATMEEARGHSGGNGGVGGDLLYRWGNPRAYGHGDADDQRLFWQHNTQWIAQGLPGAGNILAFNNGNELTGDERGYSSVDEIVPPVEGDGYRRAEDGAYPPDEPEWTYTAETPADFYAPIISGAQRLPNGNTLVVDGTAGIIFQATPDGKAVWKYIVPHHYHISLWQDEGAPARLTHGKPNADSPQLIKNVVYRASWHSPNHPGLQALDLTPGARLEDYPDPLDWASAAIAAGDFGRPLARSHYDIYLDEDERMLTYFKQPCAAEDTHARVFLHIIPADARDLPMDRNEYGFNHKDFNFEDQGKASDGWCIAARRLPDYPIERISTGQFGSGSWRVEIELGE